MKLWDSLTTCLILLSAVGPSSLLRSRHHRLSAERREGAPESPLEVPPVQILLSVISPNIIRAQTAGKLDTGGEKYNLEEIIQSDKNVMDFIKTVISRVRRSSSAEPSSTYFSFSSHLSENWSSRTQLRRERKKGAKLKRGEEKRKENKEEEMTRKSVRGGGSGRGPGCVLRQIHLNVTDLGLGYSSSEEMIFKYCSGPCRKSETNYDKILFNLVNKRKLSTKDMPLQACCRPIAFDDDLSFLDDNLIYHIMRKHSARKCGCV
ncbi:glial cell line-derived neurotrophic factor-like [Girardinichthys multiradiatus]|uniref:glial cell line-derived neurotrophic factor-like n=1 Tax=Girardinichthys multiradiatus TaxID=208333 RepID=UPI001FABB8F7|nr:glial cell line-derived neurotrophic factor-like [Girardinichthys multiradiatus]